MAGEKVKVADQIRSAIAKQARTGKEYDRAKVLEILILDYPDQWASKDKQKALQSVSNFVSQVKRKETKDNPPAEVDAEDFMTGPELADKKRMADPAGWDAATAAKPNPVDLVFDAIDDAKKLIDKLGIEGAKKLIDRLA